MTKLEKQQRSYQTSNKMIYNCDFVRKVEPSSVPTVPYNVASIINRIHGLPCVHWEASKNSSVSRIIWLIWLFLRRKANATPDNVLIQTGEPSLEGIRSFLQACERLVLALWKYQVVMAVTLTASYWWQEPMPPSCTICTLAPRLACGIHATVYWIGCNMYTHTHMPHTHVYTHELDLVWNILQNKIPPLIQEEDSCSFIILLDVIRHIVDRQVSVFRKTFCFEIFLKFESKIFTSVSWRKSGNQ